MTFIEFLIESNTPPDQYNAQIEIASRNNSRRGQWSTKGVQEKIRSLGYEIQGLNPNLPPNQLIQVVKLSGTREEIIKARTEISRALKTMSHGTMGFKFRLIKD